MTDLESLNKQIETLAVGQSFRLEGVSEDVYHASSGFGSTKIKKFMELPALLKADLDGLMPPMDSPALAKGSAFHMAVLEPDRFAAEYTSEAINLRTKAGKERKAEIEASGMKLLSESDMAEIIAMRDSCLSKFGQFLRGSCNEVSYWRRHPSGVICKARVDAEIGDLACDLKSTRDVMKFRNQARNLRYDIQAVHYIFCTWGHLSDMVFLPTLSAAPYLSGTPLLIEQYRKDIVRTAWESAIEELADSLAFDTWRGLPDEPETLDVAPWEKLDDSHD